MTKLIKQSKIKQLNDFTKQMIKEYYDYEEKTCEHTNRDQIRFKTENSFFTITLEDEKEKTEVYSIFGRFDDCPAGEMNSKKNLHRCNLDDIFEEIDHYIYEASMDIK